MIHARVSPGDPCWLSQVLDSNIWYIIFVETPKSELSILRINFDLHSIIIHQNYDGESLTNPKPAQNFSKCEPYQAGLRLRPSPHIQILGVTSTEHIMESRRLFTQLSMWSKPHCTDLGG